MTSVEAREVVDAAERLGADVGCIATHVDITWSWLDRLRILFGRRTYVVVRVHHVRPDTSDGCIQVLGTESHAAVAPIIPRRNPDGVVLAGEAPLK